MLASSTSSASGILASIKPQEIELGTIDLANNGIRVDGIYFYKNTNKDTEFMSFDKITRSLYKVIANYYPILVGRPTVNSEGKAVVAVNPESLCMPDVKEVQVGHPAESFFVYGPNNGDDLSKGVKFFDLHKFYRTDGVERIPHATYHRDHSSVIVRVLRFKDSAYAALAYSLLHGIFDATATIAFMNHWAEYARNIDNTAYKLSSLPVHDRNVMYSRFDGIEPIEQPFVEHFKDMAGTARFDSPENVAPVLLSTPDIPQIAEQHLLHISAANLERMRQEVDDTQTTAMVLTAVLTKSMVQANTRSFGTEPQTTYVAVAYDSRQRSGVPQNFAGNASFICIAPLQAKYVVGSSYKELAQTIKESSMKTDSAYSKASIETIENELGLLYHASFSLCNSPQSSYLGFSNVRYLPFKTIDFGYGSPEILSFDYFSKEGMCRMYPNFQDGGIDLFINYADACFEHLCKIDLVAKYVDAIY
ncbi:hypothetical protein IW140_004169 [Coemansia sp. RSA 1813]|nr:hypothetical protein EV178_002286 [Coemansia sp. RSA 1646]KAJ1769576.1 hypothetical protein LPJ74_003938 [Coemansia sp. RSA 1843]KAJ2090046.1 hypothetical protein IW138_003016 [Coemansia sp. RSA 986]KAJ2216995.1 hypothetical protein EV179_000761 [Coemansia sp. RSA 487]KAJ2568081.1 hypothetical protein IW140_004169 [Coemansia sp. RSA 1813]